MDEVDKIIRFIGVVSKGLLDLINVIPCLSNNRPAIYNCNLAVDKAIAARKLIESVIDDE
ncbi:hypothetical protein FACS1894140_4960 [Spirochaetia bacterium]|nr:hypothetical protein FACS1894140_4960 [Spirochaetia bacterium]